MSKRITTDTEIKQRDLALVALKKAGFTFTDEGNNCLRIHSGPQRGATLDLTTGRITGDTDRNTPEGLGALKKFYAEAKLVSEIVSAGGYIEEQTRQVQKDGSIVFEYHI